MFCQVLPPEEWLRQIPEHLIWLPMWDSARFWGREFWLRLPSSLRVVAFSKHIAQHADEAGIRYFQLQYFKNPQDFAPAQSNERVLFYWNRTGLVQENMLRSFCEYMRIERLIFRSHADPGVSESRIFVPPSRLGHTVVEVCSPKMDHDSYLRKLSEANVFIAPRAYEGVGLSFLEALASGCAVLAYNAPTMNEYITHLHDGFLLKNKRSGLWDVLSRFFRRLPGLQSPMPHLNYAPLLPDQDWALLSTIDFTNLGLRARARHQVGFQLWISQQELYATFLAS
ncbi:MAG: glycosyltransferase [Chloroflexi bacterium]|nr:glycosyltransferase [Chloroflexota bacterium]